MRIGVLSDTHGHLGRAQGAKAVLENLNLILHAGDLASDAPPLERMLQCKVIAVSGNCDINSMEPSEKILDIEGKKIFLTHGHLYRVKFGVDKLYYRAKELSVDLVVFGHTHVPYNEVIDDILFFNPGSLSLPRSGPGSFGILEISGSDIGGFIESV